MACCSAYDVLLPRNRRKLEPRPLQGIGEVPFFLDEPARTESAREEEERFLAEVEADPTP